MDSRFLNVDLDVRCRAGVAPLLRALGKTVMVLHAEETWASLELSGPQPSSAEEAIKRYAKLVRALSTRGKAAWRRCDARTMNIGVEAGTVQEAGVYSLDRATLRLLDALAADVVFTVYPTR